QGINLDDVFSGVFFSPEGDLLDIPSDGDESLNLTLSSASISEGTNHPQFAQFAVLSGGDGGYADAGGSGVTGGSGAGGETALLNPVRDSSHQLQDLLGAGAAGSSVGGVSVSMDTDDSGAAVAAAAAAEAAAAAAQARAAQDMAISKAEQAVKAAQAYAQVKLAFFYSGA
ncbi:unnamed protein product, partial [Hapterophycus canaliculatus]